MLQHRRENYINFQSYHSGLIEIAIASYTCRSGHIGIIIASNSYRSKVITPIVFGRVTVDLAKFYVKFRTELLTSQLPLSEGERYQQIFS
jgi:hypothetical protein